MNASRVVMLPPPIALGFAFSVIRRRLSGIITPLSCMPENSNSEADRETQPPCPTPLPGAVQAGIFGMTDTGPMYPGSEEVRALTEEHAAEMIAVLSDRAYLWWCRKHSLDPKTGKPLRRADGSVRERIDRELSALSSRYADLLFVYEEAFGEEAVAALDRFVRSRVSEIEEQIQRPVQKTLF